MLIKALIKLLKNKFNFDIGYFMKNYIIAEIGTSHQGDFEEAKKLIDAAAFSGADCVKFQWVYA